MGRMAEFLKGWLREARNVPKEQREDHCATGCQKAEPTADADGRAVEGNAPGNTRPLPDGVIIQCKDGTDAVASPPEKLEIAYPALLERIQSLLGVSLELSRNAGGEASYARLLDGVNEFPWILKGEGLDVDSSGMNGRQDAYTAVVGDETVSESRVLRPAILRDGETVLKGVLLVPPKALAAPATTTLETEIPK